MIDDAGAAENGQRDAAAPADAVEVGDAVAQEQRQQHQPAPDAAVERQVGRREADVDAVPRGGEARGPEHRRAGAAEDADGAADALFGRLQGILAFGT